MPSMKAFIHLAINPAESDVFIQVRKNDIIKPMVIAIIPAKMYGAYFFFMFSLWSQRHSIRQFEIVKI